MTASESFRAYIDGLDSRTRRLILREIRAQCDNASITVIYNWRCGKTRIRQSYRDKITSIIHEDIFADVTD